MVAAPPLSQPTPVPSPPPHIHNSPPSTSTSPSSIPTFSSYPTTIQSQPQPLPLQKSTRTRNAPQYLKDFHCQQALLDSPQQCHRFALSVSFVCCLLTKQVFYLDHRREQSVAARDVALPKLRELTLSGPTNVFSFCPEGFCSSGPAVEDFTVDHCSNLTIPFNAKGFLTVSIFKLCYRILSGLRYGFKILEYFNITNCGVTVVFQTEGPNVDAQAHKLSLPSLKELELKNLQELKVLSKGPNHILTLQNLTILGAKHCPKLR
ncbi:hypothetical protein Patl1_05231 [Pistacia atlantica]|uniref:Uncharacterized protein n=1 Tax=Pistacia atlantica TaxID=434234 RepID=A0ACC1BR29_9ROSI|nr:hypothetical protein Patl1_05231 [Pistacia atlantica]